MRIPPPQGAFRPIVTDVGGGMRWTVLARETNALEADGKDVWSWRPDAGVKPWVSILMVSRRRASVVSNHEARIVCKELLMASFLAMTEVLNSPAFPRNSPHLSPDCRLPLLSRFNAGGEAIRSACAGRRVRGSAAGLVRHGSVMGIC